MAAPARLVAIPVPLLPEGLTSTVETTDRQVDAAEVLEIVRMPRDPNGCNGRVTLHDGTDVHTTDVDLASARVRAAMRRQWRSA